MQEYIILLGQHMMLLKRQQTDTKIEIFRCTQMEPYTLMAFRLDSLSRKAMIMSAIEETLLISST